MDRAAFCCGEWELCEFFQNHAADHHEKYLARTYVALYEGEVVGYYWLVTQSHIPGRVSNEALSKLGSVTFAPCVYLGMIAVRYDLHGNRIGKALMMHAFSVTLEVAERAGVYALTLWAIDQDKADTYRRWGFAPFIEGELWMYIPLYTIRKLLSTIPR
jgi:GNAT superfamily N-acetyltransferase